MKVRLPAYRSRLWREWTTRSPQSPFSLAYSKNCHRAAAFFLSDYVLAAPARRRSFESMFTQMHRLTVGSLRRVAVANYNPQSNSPGVTRDRLVKSTALGRLAATNLFVHFAPELQTCFRKLGVLRTKQPVQPVPVEAELAYRGRNYRFTLLARRDWICYHPKIGNVGRQSRVEIALGERYQMGVPPSPLEVPALLKRGARLLERAIDTPALQSPRSTARWLKIVARYYQMVTVSHPFKSQNNSLLMNQVNCLLFVRLGVCVPHGNLDGFALMLPTTAFEEIFVDHVMDTLQERPHARAH